MENLSTKYRVRKEVYQEKSWGIFPRSISSKEETTYSMDGVHCQVGGGKKKPLLSLNREGGGGVNEHVLGAFKA